MKAKVDPSVCTGCGLCVDMCSEVFAFDGSVAIAKINPVPTENEISCRDAADGCPVNAISIEE